MNFVKMSMIVAVALAGFALQSCEKAAEQAEPNRTLTPAEVAQLIPDFEDFAVSPYTRGEIVSPENPANPFDHVGAAHNLALQNTAGVENTVGNPKDFLTQVSEDFGISMELCNLLHENLSMSDYKVGFRNLLATIDEPNVRVCVERMLQTSMHAVENLNTDYTPKMILYVTHVEDALVKSDLLSDREKEILLSTTSVLRMSANYWASVYSVGEGEEPSVRGLVINLSRRRSWWQWLVLVCSDAVSGAIGAAIGGPEGAIAVGAAGSYIADRCME